MIRINLISGSWHHDHLFIYTTKYKVLYVAWHLCLKSQRFYGKAESETTCWPNFWPPNCRGNAHTHLFRHLQLCRCLHIFRHINYFTIKDISDWGEPELTLEPSAKGTRKVSTERPKMFFTVNNPQWQGFKEINPFPHKICNSWACLQIIRQPLYFQKPISIVFHSCLFSYSDISDKCKYFCPFFSFFSSLFFFFITHSLCARRKLRR